MREDLVDTTQARVSAIVMQAHECAPWHHHTESVEHLFCLMGEVEVQLLEPERSMRLKPGERCTVDAQRLHRLVNPSVNPAQYLMVQSGEHDVIEDFKRQAG